MYDEDASGQNPEMIANVTDLSAAISKLEMKKSLMEGDIKNHVHLYIESLKPVNILKQTLQEVQESTPLKHNLVKIILGLGAGYVSRKLVVGKSAGLIKKALGTALQYSITQLVAKADGEVHENNSFISRKISLLKRIFSI